MNYTIITAGNKDYRMKLRAAYMDELETRIGGALTDKLAEINRLGLCMEIIAAAIDPVNHTEAKKQAAELYEDMIDEGKNLRDYQMIVLDLMVAAGFMSAAAVAAQKKAAEIQTKMAEMIAEKESQKLEARFAETEKLQNEEKAPTQTQSEAAEN